MSKFNLKTYQKINGDEHIDMRLKESRKDAPNVINEKQLEDYRATESNVTIEKMLADKRTGPDTEITEKRLDTHKSKFANKYRNPAAYEGDLNKLEEQRLQGEPVEKEKYEAASEAPKQFRWWEGAKSPDGLKLAKSAKKVVMAQEDKEKAEEMEFDEPRWQEMKEEDVDIVDDDTTEKKDTAEDFDITEKDDSTGPTGSIEVLKEKFLPNPDKPYLSGIYMVLGFNMFDFHGNEEEVKKAAFDKVTSLYPDLSGLISPDDFYSVSDDADETSGLHTIKLRASGEEFAPFVEKSTAPQTEGTLVDYENPEMKEISYEEKTIDGTPMAVGRIDVGVDVTEENKDSLVNQALGFISELHPNIKVEKDSLDLTDLAGGEIRFFVGVEEMTEEDFPVEVTNEPSANIQGELGITEPLPVSEPPATKSTEEMTDEEYERYVNEEMEKVNKEYPDEDEKTPAETQTEFPEEQLEQPEDFPVKDITMDDSRSQKSKELSKNIKYDFLNPPEEYLQKE